MKGISRYLFVAAILVMVGALTVMPLTAQEGEEGSGGIIIESSFGGDPATLNPLLTSDHERLGCLRLIPQDSGKRRARFLERDVPVGNARLLARRIHKPGP
jgi:hypothetical protein